MADDTHQAKQDAIGACYLFEGVSDDVLSALAASSVIETAPARRGLFVADDEADGLRIVMEGLVRIWINDADGQELTITLAEPGDSIGEIALLDGQARSANATTMEPCTLLFLSRASFDTVFDRNPAFARQIVILLCERLRRNTDDLRGFAFDSLQARLAKKIHELAFSHASIKDGAAHFERTFSQTDLAQMLGATREAVNKRLAAMTKAGLIELEQGRIIVPDLSLLASED